MALILEVKEGESISMDRGNIVVGLKKIGSSKIRLSITAPDDVDIGRPYTSIKPPSVGDRKLLPPKFAR